MNLSLIILKNGVLILKANSFNVFKIKTQHSVITPQEDQDKMKNLVSDIKHKNAILESLNYLVKIAQKLCHTFKLLDEAIL